jgi:hypothetical protein
MKQGLSTLRDFGSKISIIKEVIVDSIELIRNRFSVEERRAFKLTLNQREGECIPHNCFNSMKVYEN